MVHNVQSPNRRLNHLRGVHLRITVGKNSKSHTSIPLWCTTGMCTMFYGAQKSLPSTTSRDDCHGTCETLRSAERQGPTGSELVEPANSTTPLILYRLQKESSRYTAVVRPSVRKSVLQCPEGPRSVRINSVLFLHRSTQSRHLMPNLR